MVNIFPRNIVKIARILQKGSGLLSRTAFLKSNIKLARQSESYEKLFLLNCSSSPRLRRRLYTGVPTKAKGGRERGGRRKRSFILISRASKQEERENKHRIGFVLFLY